MKRIHKLFLLILIVSCTPPNSETSNGETHELKQFLDNFDAAAGRGSSALEDELSIASFEEKLALTRSMLSRLREFDIERMALADQIDWQFAQSILAGRELDQAEMRFWLKDPRRYMDFRGISNTIGRPGDIGEKIKELDKRLKLVPIRLENGKKQLEVFVPRFQELSLFMAENGRILFEKELPYFIEQQQGAADHLIEYNQQALKALEAYITYLKNELPSLPKGDFAIGKETYDKMLRDKFLLKHDSNSLWEFGWLQFRKTQEELIALAKTIDPNKTWQELIIEIKNDYPDPHQMIEAHQLWVDKGRDHIVEKDLMLIPWKERVQVVPRAEYLRKTSYYGNFSRARGEDEEGIFTAKWMINPYEDQWDKETKQQYLVEHDWGVIIVTAPHEAYGGHHVQGLYQMHNPRKIRRENGISIFSEGWGLYNEHLMQETGFFPNERIHLRQLQLRLWRNARVIYDVGMHSGRMSYEEAISLMENEVGFLRWAAQLEIDSATASPGYFIGYFLGMFEILQMREEYKQKMRDDFSLKDFHEKIMKIGNMPTSLMRMALMADV